MKMQSNEVFEKKKKRKEINQDKLLIFLQKINIRCLVVKCVKYCDK